MRNILLLVVCVMILTVAHSATAQESETFSVDWEEALAFGEKSGEYVTKDGVTNEIYYDNVQNVVWEQPKGEDRKQVLADLYQTEEGGGRSWTHISPSSLKICYDESCNSYDSYGTFVYTGTTSNVDYWYVFSATYTYDAERLNFTGSSSSTNHCSGAGDDADAWVYPGPYVADNVNTCYYLLGNYVYVGDDIDHIEEQDYPGGGEYIFRFTYYYSDTYYQTRVRFGVIE